MSDMMKEQEIRKFPSEKERVETGPIQFGEDWPGIFIRGDNSFAYILALNAYLNGTEDVFTKSCLRGLRDVLSECIIGPASKII